MIQEKSYYHVDTWPVLVFVNKCVTNEAILMGGLEALSQMSPLFIPSKKKSFSSTFTPLTLNPPHFLDIENQNHESLKSVERVILPLPVALVLLSYLSIFRCPAPGEKQKYQVTLHF